MKLLADKIEYKDADLNDGNSFKKYVGTNPTGLKIVHAKRGDNIVEQGETGNFVKWLRINNKNINVEYERGTSKLIMESHEIWFPLVFLANNIALPIYLNIVANYLCEKSKGLLQGENIQAHLNLIHEDKKTGKIKRLNFSGNHEALNSVIEKINLNKFME